MKLMFVYKFLPALLFYTDNIKEKFGGMTYGPVVKIRNKYKDDRGLLEHELNHVKQWYRTLGTHGIWYRLSEKYRLKCEIESYKIQASYYDYDSTGWMADTIISKYGIKKLDRNQVINLLK